MHFLRRCLSDTILRRISSKCPRGVQGRRLKRSKLSQEKGQGYDPFTAVGGGSLLKKIVPRKHCVHYRERRLCSAI